MYNYLSIEKFHFFATLRDSTNPSDQKSTLRIYALPLLCLVEAWGEQKGDSGESPLRDQLLLIIGLETRVNTISKSKCCTLPKRPMNRATTITRYV